MAEEERQEHQGDELDEELSGDDVLPKVRRVAREERKKNRELEKRLAEQESELRTKKVQAALRERGYSDRAAVLYPDDGEVNFEAIEQWAVDTGIGRDVPPGPGPETLESLNRYSRVVQQSFGAPPEPSEEERLLSELSRGMDRIMDTPGVIPRPEDKEKAEQLADRVNSLNKRYAREIENGRRPRPDNGGIASYGGRTNPPWYADKTRRARADY